MVSREVVLVVEICVGHFGLDIFELDRRVLRTLSGEIFRDVPAPSPINLLIAILLEKRFEFGSVDENCVRRLGRGLVPLFGCVASGGVRYRVRVSIPQNP